MYFCRKLFRLTKADTINNSYKVMKKTAMSILLALLAMAMAAQTSNVHEQSDGYEWPTDTLVVKNLGAW